MKIERPDRHQTGTAVQSFTAGDEAIRAIQGLKVAGFEEDKIRVVSRDSDAARYVADATGVRAEAADEMGSEIDQTRRAYDESIQAGHLLVFVEAGESTAIAKRVMRDGLVDGTGLAAPREEGIYMDTSTGSGAGVATSTGTAMGISPGSGYEPNTGSSVKSIPNPHGQFAPGADTPNREDDFPG